MPSKLASVFRPVRQALGALTGEPCTIGGMAGTFYVTFDEEGTSVSLQEFGSDESIEITARFSRTDFPTAPPFGATLTRDGGMRYEIGQSGYGPNSWTTSLKRLDLSTPSPHGDQFPV